MKNLKIRVWNTELNDWLHDCNLKDTVFGCNSGYKHNSERGFAEIHPNQDHPEYIIEQDTGLKDKNGKEIYEGDIVKKTDAICKIEFYDDVACFGYSENTMSGKPIRYAIKGEELEVIGNIHENPELLGGEE